MLDQHWIMKYCILLHVPLLIVKGASDSFVPPPLPNGRLCYCAGVTETFTCTVVGGTVTQWRGTAFDCAGNIITLIHDQYPGGTIPGPANGACGDLEAEGTAATRSGSPNCYTSVLRVPIASNLDGLTVNCSRDGVDEIGTHTLRIATPPPPPTNLMVTKVHQSIFNITWTGPISDCGTLFSYDFDSTCGATCSATSSTSGVCSGWTIGQTCSVRVRASMCPGQPGSFSTPVTLILQEPSPPSTDDISVVVTYCEKNLSNLVFTFPTVDPVTIAPGLTPPVTYFIQITGNNPQTVPGSSCTATQCQHQITVDDVPTNDLSVTLTVSNEVGSGQSIMFPQLAPADPTTLVTVTAVVMGGTSVSISAQLMDNFQGSTNLVITYSIEGNSTTNTVTSTMNGGAGDTLSVTLTSLESEVAYEYTAVVISGTLTLQIKNVFNIECLEAKLGTISTSRTPSTCQMDGFEGGVFIAYGFVCYTGRGLGSGRAVASCDQGYTLSSSISEMRQCQPDGTWSGTPAECLQIYALPVAIVAGSVVVSFVLILVSVVIAVLLIVLEVKKDRKADNNNGNETEMRSPPPIYEEPDDILPDPQTQGNIAYGHVQFRQ